MQPLKVYEIYQKTTIIKSTISCLGNKYKIDHQLEEIVKKNDRSSWSTEKTTPGNVTHYEFETRYTPLESCPEELEKITPACWTTKRPVSGDLNKYRKAEIYNNMGTLKYESQETHGNDTQYSNKSLWVPKHHLASLKTSLEVNAKEIMKTHFKN